MTDRNVYQILEHITRTRVKIRQGRSSTLITAPVDFTDLSSEYIGILYEGLLDFELKTAPPNDPVIFLAIGDQPALPLSRLEQMEDKDLKDLLEKMKDKSSADGESEDEEAEEAADEEETPESEDEVADEETEEELIEDIEEEEPEAEDERHATRTRAETWARRAVIAGKLVRKPRGTLTPEKTLLFEDMIGRKARQLVIRVILPGEWFLVRWGGTRKGAGTFYTRPGLAVPTVQRTLRPLAWEAPVDTKGKPDPKAPAADWTPKKPEEILNLKVCDPACGSGTFPVAALRFLTDSLYKSVHHHKRIREKGNDSVVSLLGIAPSSTSSELALGQEQLGCRPDDERFELSLKAVLRRHVVERCIYGVDLDPLAVELCRLALWIETMDRTLPFSFLDHKIKRGNALVGAWFDQFQHYPAMAWKNRDGGDKGHTNGVHFKKDERTKAIKAFVKDKLQGDLAATIMAQLGQRRLGEKEFVDPVHVHKEALDILSRLHDLPVQDSAERARIYREELLGSEAYRSLKSAMNRWCACWFWPANKLDDAPLPSTLADPSQRTREIADRMAAEKGFFHWELEFPDVFFEEGSGFDAMLGNPPWENLQPNPEEYFSNYDPLFRTYGNLVKRECRNSMYEKHREIEVRWLDFCADFRSFSHWVTHAANPFGDPSSDCGGGIFPLGHGGKEIHNRWRKIRAKSKSYAQSNHIFRYQMGRIFTYKLFLEQCHALLRDGGRLGQIIPSGLYSDAWSKPLRELFLDHCRWEWLFGFENRAKLFDIDSRFKFNPVIIEKGGKTAAIRTAFMRRNLEDWERAENFVTDYSRAQVDQFSPRSKAILEIQSARDLEILEKIYSNSVLLGDDGPDGWGIKYKLEFMMNTDAHLFPPRPKWEAQGYRPDEYSRWLKGDWRPIGELWAELGVDPTKPVPVEIELEDWLFDTTAGPERRTAEAQFVHGHLLKPGDVARTQWRVRCAQPPYDSLPIPRADIPEGIILSREADAWIHEDRIEDTALPLYEGRLFSAYDFAAKAWISGSGLSARWNQVDWSHKLVNPQYLASLEDVNTHPRVITSPKVSYRNIARNTDTRSMIATVICGDPTPHMTSNLVLLESSHAWALCASLNSFVADFAVRQRLTGTHIDQHLATELPVLPIKWSHHLSKFALSLAAGNQKFAPALLKWSSSLTSWKSCWALTQSNRLAHLSSLDAIAFAAFGFNDADVQHILKDCDSPVSYHSSVRSPDLSARGFWRIDRDKIPAHRHTVLSIVAFYFLEQLIESKGGDLESGIAAYCNQNGGDGWLLPETLRLSDYGLGEEPWSQDDQSVAKQLGQRFYDWQLVQGIEESWDECHLHARNVLGKWNYEKVCEGKKNGTKSFCKVAPKYSQYGSEYFTSFGQMRLNYENKDEN
ncbi:MAG: hypothetical protein KJ927_20270 [Candidatus Eisenbacteria bacterium]|nr:hypothetical protein [Candidatus Eisenbacteria bacterium]